MRTRVTRIAVGGALGLAVLGGGAVVVPAVASAAVSPETDTATEVAERVTRITDALAGLVSDGTIDQQQADAVAQRLAEDGFGGRHGPGHGPGHGHAHGGHGLTGGLDAAAEALGMTEDELREAVADGDTLAEVAEQQGVEAGVVVDALVTAAQDRLSQAVEDGRLTQAEADEKAADLQERITAFVEQGGPLGRGHRHGRFGGGAARADSADSAEPAQTPQPEVEGSATSVRVPSGGVVAL